MIRYLKGETIEVDDLVDHKEKGWQLVLDGRLSARLWETCKRNFEEQNIYLDGDGSHNDTIR